MSLLLILCLLFPISGIAQEADEAADDQPMPIFCQEYLGQIEFIKSRIIQMAEAFPQEKYSWRPGEGVRSVSEVYRHIALANYNLLKKTGFEQYAGIDLNKDRKSWIEETNSKIETITFLNQSFDAVSEMAKHASQEDLDKMQQIFGMEMSVRNFMITILNHMHQHLGQSIAYARMNGIVPPWSVPAPKPPTNVEMKE
jgi:uncharacterized damage-inducible protein DinB